MAGTERIHMTPTLSVRHQAQASSNRSPYSEPYDSTNQGDERVTYLRYAVLAALTKGS